MTGSVAYLAFVKLAGTVRSVVLHVYLQRKIRKLKNTLFKKYVVYNII